MSEAGKAKLRAVAEQRKVYSAARSALFKRKAEQGVSDEFKADIAGKLLPELKKYLAAVDDVVSYQDALFQAADDRIDAVYASSRTLLLALGLFALVCGIRSGTMADAQHHAPAGARSGSGPPGRPPAT